MTVIYFTDGALIEDLHIRKSLLRIPEIIQSLREHQNEFLNCDLFIAMMDQSVFNQLNYHQKDRLKTLLQKSLFDRWCRQGAEPDLGPVRVVRAQFSFVLADTADIRLEAELEGGALMDVGCYCVSAIRAIAGEPHSLAGEEVLGPTSVDLVFAGTARCADGVLAHFDCGFAMPYRAGIEVAGEDGFIVVPDPWHATEPGIEVHRENGVERIEVPHADSYRLELENVADAISGAAPLLLGRDDAVGQARAIDALYRSAGS